MQRSRVGIAWQSSFAVCHFACLVGACLMISSRHQSAAHVMRCVRAKAEEREDIRHGMPPCPTHPGPSRPERCSAILARSPVLLVSRIVVVS